VGVLVKKLRPTRGSLRGHKGNLVPDTWIYIQEPDVKLGRLQLFNNWSPAMVRDADTIWLGLEYFCQEGDELWCLSDEEMGRFAVDELARIDLIDAADALDFNVVRVPKAYPAYFGTYDQFEVLRRHTDTIENLFLGYDRKSVSGRAKRHAPVQQSGPFHAHGPLGCRSDLVWLVL